jgi:hypothetical protein
MGYVKELNRKDILSQLEKAYSCQTKAHNLQSALIRILKKSTPSFIAFFSIEPIANFFQEALHRLRVK